MKLWPVLTGIALSFTLIACKAEGFVYLTVDTIQRKINGARAKVKHTLLEILKLQR